MQSSAMALMASHGLFDVAPDLAIFADTQAEPATVYKWLDWLEPKLKFPVLRVTKGDLYRAALVTRNSAKGGTYMKTNVPCFTRGTSGKVGLSSFRDCTAKYKIEPIQAELRRQIGPRVVRHWLYAAKTDETIPSRPLAVTWIGISTNEATRMKPSRVPWIRHEWPLLDAGLNREACVKWMTLHGYPTPPRSACVFCAFHSNATWRELKTSQPEDYAKAAKFESELQAARPAIPGGVSEPYLHKSCKPLGEINWEVATEDNKVVVNSFENECEGMCGV